MFLSRKSERGTSPLGWRMMMQVCRMIRRASWIDEIDCSSGWRGGGGSGRAGASVAQQSVTINRASSEIGRLIEKWCLKIWTILSKIAWTKNSSHLTFESLRRWRTIARWREGQSDTYVRGVRSRCRRFLNQLLTWVNVKPVFFARRRFSSGVG